MTGPVIRFLTACCCLIFLCSGTCHAGAFEGNLPERPCRLLSGTFIQLNSANAKWPAEKWDEAFRCMKRIGFRQVVVQWCRQDDIRYYRLSPDPQTETGGAGVVEMIQVMCEKYGFSYYLGLFHDTDFWAEIEAPEDEVMRYLNFLERRNLEVAEELSTLIAGSPGFKGYYLPQEIDDITWREAGKRARLKKFLEIMGERVRSLTPGSHLLVSTFFRGRVSSERFAEQWRLLSLEKPVDALLVQDGIGSGLVTLPALSGQLTALTDSLRENKVALWCVVELFRELEPGGGAEDFKAVSADISRVVAQLNASQPATDAIGFSLKYFFPSPDVPGSEKFFEDYSLLIDDR